jgi:hypothetical protein
MKVYSSVLLAGLGVVAELFLGPLSGSGLRADYTYSELLLDDPVNSVSLSYVYRFGR